MFDKFFRPAAIIGALPVTLTNGTTADATQVMSDLNWIMNQVNANAAPLSNTALLNATNNFTAVQSGINATAAANFPIASQVQNNAFNTLSSTLGTNTITARVAALPLAAWAFGQVFVFVPSQANNGPASLTVDAAGSSIIFSGGATLFGSELLAGIPALLIRDNTKLNLVNPQPIVGSFVGTLTGATAVVTGVVTYTKTGNQVTLNFPAFSGTSNSAAKTITGTPAFLRPTVARISFDLSSDNGGPTVVGAQSMGVDGTVTCYPSGAAGAWTASGAFSIFGFNMNYTTA